jgi:hypothetical protein
MPDEEGLEVLADAMAEFLFGLWQLEQEQAKQRTAASAATSVEEPASTSEATHSGGKEPHHGQQVRS